VSAPLAIAAVPRAPLFDDVAAASAHILRCAKDAAAAGARLILFPESYLQGHSYTARTIARRAMPIDDPAGAIMAEVPEGRTGMIVATIE
jgi:predicted amidohydrolase